MHERPVTTPVPAKAAPQAAVSKGAQTIKERPVATDKGATARKIQRACYKSTGERKDAGGQRIRCTCQTADFAGCRRYLTTDGAATNADKAYRKTEKQDNHK